MLVARPFSRNCPAIDNAVNSTPYRHCGSTEWFHFQLLLQQRPLYKPPTFHLDRVQYCGDKRLRSLCIQNCAKRSLFSNPVTNASMRPQCQCSASMSGCQLKRFVVCSQVWNIPYSLDIMPPYYLHEFAVEVYLSPIYAPLGLCNSDE